MSHAVSSESLDSPAAARPSRPHLQHTTDAAAAIAATARCRTRGCRGRAGWPVLTGIESRALPAVDPSSGAVEEIGHTGGRPLGLHAGTDGSILICDAEHGLLRLDRPRGSVETAADRGDGQRLCFASNVVADTDGTIFFSDPRRSQPYSQVRW